MDCGSNIPSQFCSTPFEHIRESAHRRTTPRVDASLGHAGRTEHAIKSNLVGNAQDIKILIFSLLKRLFFVSEYMLLFLPSATGCTTRMRSFIATTMESKSP